MAKLLSGPETDVRLAGLDRQVAALLRRSAGRWHYVGATGEPPFLNGWTNLGAPHQTLRFRILLGGGLELQGVVDGGTPGTAVFNLPAVFIPDLDGDLPLSGSDPITGAHIAWKVIAATGGGFNAGDVIRL